MLRKWLHAIAVLVMIAGALSVVRYVRAGYILINPATPAKGESFSRVLDYGPDTDIEEMLQTETQFLRSLGLGEKEIANEIATYRSELEQDKYAPAQSIVFSVVVDDGNLEGYRQALAAQDVPDSVAQELVNALNAELLAAPLQAVEGTACKVRTDGAVMKNFFGEVLYKYSSTIRWCYNGSEITSLRDNEGYSTYWGWEFRGSTKNSSGGAGEGIYSLERNATMFNPVIELTQHPNTAQEVFGDGSSWGSANP